jgi:expansin (peptidoglycan-binding protein)
MRGFSLPGFLTGRFTVAGRRVPTLLLPLGAVALVASVATAILVAQTSGAACAAVPATVTARSGSATFYTTGHGGGNCGFGASPDDLFVALGPGEYAAAGACGSYLDVTGPRGTVRVKVTDQCPGCAAGQIDLSKQAFARIADTSAGQVAVSYRPVTNPALAGPLTVRIKSGSSRYWLAVLVDNHGNALSTVEVKSGGGFVKLARQDYNYWLKANGAGPGPYTLRITDVAGHVATVSGIGLSPDRTQTTTTSLYGPPTRPSPAMTRSPSVSPEPSTTPAAVERSAVPLVAGEPAAASTVPGRPVHCG